MLFVLIRIFPHYVTRSPAWESSDIPVHAPPRKASDSTHLFTSVTVCAMPSSQSPSDAEAEHDSKI